jgi:hypothetical protein
MVNFVPMKSEELPALIARIEAALGRVENAIALKPALIEADTVLIERHALLRASTVEAIAALSGLISQAKAEG